MKIREVCLWIPMAAIIWVFVEVIFTSLQILGGGHWIEIIKPLSWAGMSLIGLRLLALRSIRRRRRVL